jgi:mRNA interferase MazF
MPIAFHPRAGQVLVCDFEGFKVPEMVKVRPVIVISPRLPQRNGLVTVVPISLTAPKHALPFTVRLSKNYHPLEADDLPCWAKCDMVMNLGTWRLDGFKVGRRQWENPQATGEDLQAVRHGVLWGLGMGSLIPAAS